MKKLSNSHKSKTMWLAGALAIMQPMLEVFPEAKVFLGDNYGVAFVCLSGVVAFLRYLTTKPLDDK